MTPFRLLGLPPTVASVLLFSTAGRAADARGADAPSGPPAATIDAFIGDFGFGGVTSRGSDYEGGMTTDAGALARIGWFEAGARGEVGTGFLSNHRVGVGALAGVGFHRWPVGLDVLGEAGVRRYGGVETGETGLFDDTSGASATLPYVGLRLGLDVPFGAAERGHTRWFVGLGLGLRHEPVATTTSYPYTRGDVLGTGDLNRGTAVAELGGATELGASLRFGFDIAR